ncbi:MAG: GNAT family N-acetyltransferase [Anaerolineae bacterium]|nr:GNAT family N-acetyltransferase [Anaerolineae bacterium]
MQSTISIVEHLPTAAQFVQMRQAVGWRLPSEEAAAQALPHSLYGVCAYVGEQLVGMGRIIGDNGLAYYIQDVMVLPEYQRQGIGTQLMDKIMAYIRAHAPHNAVVGLMAATGKEPFYEKYGFTRRPNERLGAGMTIFWQADGGA